MVDDDTMAKILYLSRLSAQPSDLTDTKRQIDSILDYFEMLSRYDTSKTDIDPGSVIGPADLRDDEPRPCLTTQQVKSFAVEFLDGYFSVPRILDDES